MGGDPLGGGSGASHVRRDAAVASRWCRGAASLVTCDALRCGAWRRPRTLSGVCFNNRDATSQPAQLALPACIATEAWQPTGLGQLAIGAFRQAACDIGCAVCAVKALYGPRRLAQVAARPWHNDALCCWPKLCPSPSRGNAGGGAEVVGGVGRASVWYTFFRDCLENIMACN